MPAYLAARRRKLPIVVHEENALPGLANKARRPVRAAGRGELPGHRRCRTAEYVGLPIRRMISTLDRAALRAEAREFFGLDPDRPTLLVTGGSQGARRLNEAVSGAAARARRRRRPGAARRRAEAATVDVRAADRRAAVRRRCRYVDRMDLAYAAADLVLCRAGANSVTEAAAVGLPAVFVPLPIGNGEQALNARPVVDAGGGLLVDDAALTAGVGRGDGAAAWRRTRRGWPTMGAAAAGADPARRRREAGPDRPRGRAATGSAP